MDGNPLDMPKLEVWGDPISLVSMIHIPGAPACWRPAAAAGGPAKQLQTFVRRLFSVYFGNADF